MPATSCSPISHCRADHAVLHDTGDVLPGIVELVEAYRHGPLQPDQLHPFTYDVPERGYQLLLGLRRHREWTALRRVATRAALSGLLATWQFVVADIDPDIEGDDECGSIDVEERNALARTTLELADLVLVVGRSDVTGLHRLLVLLTELMAFGIEPPRLLPVINRTPRNPRLRSEITQAVSRLAGELHPDPRDLPNPLFLQDRHRLHLAVSDHRVLPASVCTPVTRAVLPLLERLDVRTADAAPTPVSAGSLGMSALSR